MKASIRIGFILAASLVACGGSSKKTAAPASTVAANQPATPPAASQTAGSANVHVDDDLAAKCNLTFSSVDAAPKFDYDESQLEASDRNVLQQVADCLVKGPLKGKSVKLVGRADPRGTEEYNLGLGTRRAESVRSYLQRLGVPAARLSPSTRGDLDASGSDETSYRRDRRVDLKLVN